MDDEEKLGIYTSTTEELRFSIDNQLEAYQKITKWSTDLIKINFLAIGAISAGVSFSDFSLSLIFLAALSAFLYSIWSAAKVLHPAKLVRGMGPKFIEETKGYVDDDIEVWQHYKGLSEAYADDMKEIPEVLEDYRHFFLSSLWSAVCAFLFTGIYIVIQVSAKDIPLSLEYPLLFIIPIIALWGKDMQEESE